MVHPPVQHHSKAEEKSRLREVALLRRQAVSQKLGAFAAQAIAERGKPLILSLGLTGVIAGYRAMRGELDPCPLLTALRDQGSRIALPCMASRTTLIFREWTAKAPLQKKKFGVEEPADTQPALLPALVLVPLLAFDCHGNRLGYGAGYYDGALRDLRSRGRVVAIGVAFDEQEWPEIPHEPQDEPLDMILTPSRVLPCEA